MKNKLRWVDQIPASFKDKRNIGEEKLMQCFITIWKINYVLALIIFLYLYFFGFVFKKTDIEKKYIFKLS